MSAYSVNGSAIALVVRFSEEAGTVWVVLAIELINKRVQKKKRAFI